MKLMLAIAFGTGYVLGARAGRERYEELSRAASRVQADPRVKDAAATVETFVRDAARHVGDDDRLAHAAASVKESAQKVAEAAPQVRERAAEAVDTVRQKVTGGESGPTASTTDEGGDDSGDDAAGPTVGRHTAHRLPDDAPTPSGATWPPHPDEHIEEPDDEIVYSAGPDSQPAEPGDGHDESGDRAAG